MNRFILIILLAFFNYLNSYAQPVTLQASIGIGTSSSRIKIYIKPIQAATNAEISTFQFNVSIPTTVSPVPSLSFLAPPVFGSGWQIDPSYIEDGYRHYSIVSVAAGALTLGAGQELEIMELEFSGGFQVLNNVCLVTLPGGGVTTGNALYYSFGDAQSVEGQLYYNRGGVTVINNMSYTGPLPSSACLVSSLPVKFSSFNVSCNNSSNSIKWTTASESNNHHFEIEKSTDGINWTKIGQVPAAGNGNSNTTQAYQYFDLQGGNNVYRIKQVDIDGKFIYTNVMRTNCSGYKFIADIYPVPAKDNLNIHIQSDKDANTEIRIIDFEGKLIRRQKINIARGNNYYLIDVKDLPSAQYVLVSENPSLAFQRKFTVVR